MTDLASKNDFSKLLNKLEAYTTLESFNKMRIGNERENYNLCEKIKDLVPKIQLVKDLDSLRDYIGEGNKTNAQKRDCLKDKKETISMVEKLQKEFLDLRDDHRESKQRLRNLELTI